MRRRNSGRDRAAIGEPSMSNSPEEGVTSPLMTFSAVVFPAPLRPRNATRSPVPICSETRSRMAFAPAFTVTSRYSITATLSVAGFLSFWVAEQQSASSNPGTQQPSNQSRHQQHLPRRSPTLQQPMRFEGTLQRQLAVDAEVERAGGDGVEQLAGAPEQLVAREDVVGEAGAGEVDAAFGEACGIDGWDDAARLAEEGEHAARADAVQALVERGFADGVVHDLDAGVVRRLHHHRLEVVGRVVDHHVRAV